MIAPISPERANGSTAIRTASQRVAPSASAPSRSDDGTARSTSRLTEEMVGVIMMARMMPPVSMLKPLCGPLNRGRKPNVLPSAGSTLSRIHGASAKMPHRP